MMETVHNFSVSPHFQNATNTTHSLQISNAQLAAVFNSESIDLDLITREGDKVTLSLDAQVSALYANYNQVGVKDENEVTLLQGSLSAQQSIREMALSVEGDLNETEKREIQKVIKTLDRMMQNFVKGQINPMLAKLDKMQGFKTIDNLSVSMAYERQAMVVQQTQAAVAYKADGTTTPLATPQKTAMDWPLKNESNALALEMAAQVTAVAGVLDTVKALADDLLKNYQDQVARRHSSGGRFVEQIRHIFNAEVSNSTISSSENSTIPLPVGGYNASSIDLARGGH